MSGKMSNCNICKSPYNVKTVWVNDSQGIDLCAFCRIGMEKSLANIKGNVRLRDLFINKLCEVFDITYNYVGDKKKVEEIFTWLRWGNWTEEDPYEDMSRIPKVRLPEIQIDLSEKGKRKKL